jgi:putative transposase
LFQDRYKSEPVEGEKYLLTVIRYIHQNPIKAGIIKNIEDYQWSSYREFIDKNEIIDVDFILGLFGKERTKAIESFRSYHKTLSNEVCLDIEERKKITDKEATDIIKKVCSVSHCIDIQEIEIERKNKYLKLLKKKGLSTRQISRLTGISRGIVLKA